MIRALPHGFELDDDPRRVDVDEVHRFLSTEAYWALGRSRETVERLVKWLLHTTDAHGLYEQFGFGPPDAKVMERLP